MSVIRTFASLSLSVLLSSGVALAQNNSGNNDTNKNDQAGTVAPGDQNPHETKYKDRKAPAKADKDQIQDAEKANPHSTQNKDRDVRTGTDDRQMDEATKSNPHHVRNKEVHMGDKSSDMSGNSGSMSGASGGAGMQGHDMNAMATPNAVIERMNVADKGEIEMGKLAQQNGEKSKDFGRMLEQDHMKAMDQVKQLAQKKGLELSDMPKDGMAKHQMDEAREMKDHLASMKGAEFDRMFGQMMADEHQKDIDMMKKWRSKVNDKEVTALIDQTLPVLQKHLTTAKGLAGK